MTIRDWDERYRTHDLVWSPDPNRFFAEEVDGHAPGRALDLACGEGRNAIWLASRGWQVTAVDFSEVALAKAQRLAASRGVEVNWVRSDLVEYGPAAGAFELVAVVYLHLAADERRRILERAARALAPGGTLLVIGHDLKNLTEGYGGPRDPRVLFTATDIEQDLRGLTIERSERVLRPTTVDGEEVNAIDVLVRARRPPASPNAA